MLQFEWDKSKAITNFVKHGVTFAEASSVFFDPLALTQTDDTRGEPRFFTVGQSLRARILVVVHTDNDETIRIISARQATARERSEYEDG